MVATLIDYLTYYRELKAPGFAVLLRGQWGIGKTFQLKKALEQIEPKDFPQRDPLNHEDHIYVSLFGIESRAQMDAEVVAASDDAAHFGTIGLRTIRKVTGGIGGWFAAASVIEQLIEPIMRRSLARSSNRLLVLDDLERCAIDSKVLFGALNYYIEHLGFKVIVIAHDERLQNELTEQKEKIFGHTITVIPDVGSALKHFICQLSDLPVKNILHDRTELIETIFQESNVYSLRILKRIVFDLSRLISCLPEEFLDKKSGLDILVATFVALESLIRSGLISEEDIRIFAGDNYSAWLDENGTGAPSPKLLQFDKLFNNVALPTTLFPREIQIDLLVNGKFDRNAIQESLRQHPDFSDRPQPAWRNVWHRFFLDDEVVQHSIETIETQFRQQEFTDHNEVMHVCAIRVSLAADALLEGNTIEQATLEGKRYIDTLLENGKLKPLERLSSTPERIEYDGSFGLGISGIGNPETHNKVIELHGYLHKQRKEALRKSLSTLYEDTMQLLRDHQVDEFSTLISDGSSTETTLLNIPIFAGRDPNEFVDLLLGLPGHFWWPVGNALQRRYDVGLINDLSDEKAWLVGFKKLASEKQHDESISPLRRARFKFLFGLAFLSSLPQPDDEI